MIYFKKYYKGEDLPWITFVHGAGGSSNIWYKQIKPFSKHFNILLIDLRGHGKSQESNHDQIYSMELVCEDVINVLDHLRINHSHFVGISLGTLVINHIALKFPERVDKVIYGGAVSQINLKGRILFNLGKVVGFLTSYIFIYKVLAYIIMPKINHKESRKIFIKEARSIKRTEFIKWIYLMEIIKNKLDVDYFSSSVNVCFISGIDDHMFIHSIQKLKSLGSKAQFNFIQNCGHVVNIQRPNSFNEIAIKFLLE